MPRKMDILKDLYAAAFEKVLIRHRRKTETRKVNEKARVAIYKDIVLSSEQKKQIDTFYLENYGQKVPHNWHRLYTAYTGKFDYRYFPELLAIPEFDRFMNPDEAYIKAFSDKNVLQMLASAAGVKMPRTVICATRGVYKDARYNVLTKAEAAAALEKQGTLFIKPSVDTSSGSRCAKICVENGIDLISGESIQTIFDQLGMDFVVQELISCHAAIQALYPNSVNTFRIITYRWNDKIEHCPVTMRIGQGGHYLDNAHAGGIFVGITDEGKLHTTAFTEFHKVFTEHMDTKVTFAGYEIPHFDKVLAAAKRMHSVLSQVGLVYWDFTINEAGEPVLIEANTKGGGIWLAEMAHGCGIFGENTADILRYMREMKKLTPAQRKGKHWKKVN